jgi:hypothetical protein
VLFVVPRFHFDFISFRDIVKANIEPNCRWHNVVVRLAAKPRGSLLPSAFGSRQDELLLSAHHFLQLSSGDATAAIDSSAFRTLPL